MKAKQAVILNAPRHQKLKEISEGIVSMFRGPRAGWSIDGDGYYHAGGDIGSEMAKAGLLEQNRLSECKS